ncbi:MULTISPECIES: hypothetical protein [Acidiplasma]|jgi:Txe/YoeB family toxin of Txe-Axe toxin-antitoxin module|uniref:Uncharacterized protein n=2 Tax=Acidiplasma TaxID=507753 RepID=A0A0Q0RKR0_9ARCH|nr:MULTISPECIES: hypothetical protein [Acidiplasma]KJE49051.1 hypothetical protein TZ01_07345 [Acidiplasma sp. MBA-1]KPV47171.1 hypothetical protein SE19_02210 [Acidiplasma aeolicum]KQB34435.1 hypothetical protein AOG54_04940 [Acidiplasma aeolicum]KQB36069.1 hypothetical protein AOG55_05165 [Acidiplasma cupricumulans]WMT54497.1 MAG: hypothetical protein RE470_06150 [Acidiplasma sp.]
MSKTFNIDSFSDRKKFEIKLQIALLKNTLKIRENSNDPSKYDEYINERIEKLKELLGTTSRFTIKEDDKILYSIDNDKI